MGHAAYGVIRAIVKDSTDAWLGPKSLSFIDSDGEVGNPLSRNLTQQEWNVQVMRS
jgi:hypothetical protein